MAETWLPATASVLECQKVIGCVVGHVFYVLAVTPTSNGLQVQSHGREDVGTCVPLAAVLCR